MCCCLRALHNGPAFDYPSQPPVPEGAQVVVQAKGSDDDDPMRGREVVLDLGNESPHELFQFYRHQFTAERGWVDRTTSARHRYLCLANRESSDYTEYLEIMPFSGTARYAGARRYIIWRSRLHKSRTNRCGLSGVWFPIVP